MYRSPEKLKLVLCGDSGSGKTCIIQRHCHDNFSNTTVSTIGLDYAFKKVEVTGEDGKKSMITVSYFDTAGQERFRSLSSGHWRGAHGIVIVYSIASRRSFLSVQDYWVDEVRKNQPSPHCFVILIGNKSDLPNRKVSREEGEEFAKKENLLFYEMSAMSGDNVSSSLDEVVGLMHKKFSVQTDLNEDDKEDELHGNAIVILDDEDRKSGNCVTNFCYSGASS